MAADLWERRAARVQVLLSLWPAGAEPLKLLGVVTDCQLLVLVTRSLLVAGHAEPGFVAHGTAPYLLEAIATHGPAAAAARAAAWKAMSREELHRRVTLFWHGKRGDPLDDCLAKLIVQPHAVQLTAGGAGECPFCATRPAVSLLREDKEAEALARTLVCSVCFSERAFPRVLCPACGEERPERLPRLSAEEIPWIRVEACDGCGRYLKAIDLTRCPEAEPIADELGSVVLDAVAHERGYVKIEPNLAGV